METNKCSECGGEACICEDDFGWAAHCMSFDNNTAKKPGYYCPIHKTEGGAIEAWNWLNRPKTDEVDHFFDSLHDGGVPDIEYFEKLAEARNRIRKIFKPGL